jgi:2-polyprenyl-6-methoxyphenol hydroxylase-like FAD-dependent oxidoreductase
LDAPDALIVGGGPAGLAAAIALRMRGGKVIVADRARPPIDKPCGEGLMPEGVAALRSLGVWNDCAPAAAPFSGIRFTEDGRHADGRFIGAQGAGIRRIELHRRLVDRAAEAGVTMRWNETVRLDRWGGAELDGRKIAPRWLIGADGRESAVRRATGFAEVAQPARGRAGLRRHFAVPAWSDLVEVHWHNDGQAVVTPLPSGEICVSAFANRPGPRFADLIARHPELHRRLAGARPTSVVRGAISGSSWVAAVTRGRVLLIGDAAGAVDAITGQGLSLAFREAIALADALAAGDPARYQRAHRALVRTARRMAQLMLAAGARHAWRRRILDALSASPRLFDYMLGIHTGADALRNLPLGAIAGFCVRAAAPGLFKKRSEAR